MGKLSLKAKRQDKQVERQAVASATSFTEEALSFFRKELDIDIVKEYKKLKTVGEIPTDKLMDRIALTKEINMAGINSKQANKIFLKARAEREYFRIEFSRAMRTINRQATTQVEEWMQNNDVKKKQITKDMIEQEIASDDELGKVYKTLIEKQEELRAILSDCELLAREWAERKWTLRTQASLVAAEKEITLPKMEG